jgi:hypothetical protein
MPLNPTNHTTWTAFSDHPIFGPTKWNINDWSLDPARYCALDSYGQFMFEHYIHTVHTPPSVEQRLIAARDITNLASTCAQIEQAFGQIKYELVILDDFTVYVWVQHPRFSVEIYPNNFPTEIGILKLFIDAPPTLAEEHQCKTAGDVIEALRQTIRR